MKWLRLPVSKRTVTILLAVGTALLSGALGILPDLATDWLPPLLGRLICLIAFTVLGGGSLWFAAGRLSRMLAEREARGIAYIVHEISNDWVPDPTQEFLATLHEHYAEVRQVLGPAQRGVLSPLAGTTVNWAWQLDDESATRWQEHLTDLVHAFRAAGPGPFGKPATPVVFIWARWPVAVALGAHLTAGQRGPSVAVGQRPSWGRAGTIDVTEGSRTPHVFTRPRLPAHCEVSEHRWTARLHLTGTGEPAPDSTPLFLVARLSPHKWGPREPLDGMTRADPTPALTIQDNSGHLADQAGTITVHELHFLGPDGKIPWPDYPAAVTTVSTWIERLALDAGPERPVVLGFNGPQEVALGLGITIGAPGRERWPAHVLPAIWKSDKENSFVIPRLELGRTAVLRAGRGS